MGKAVTILLPCLCLCDILSFCFFNFILFEYAALDSDDLLYLKEQMEAEEDAECLLRRTKKRAFAAFKISFYVIERGRVLCWNYSLENCPN